MQYKQAPRILLEILDTPELAPKIKLPLIRLLIRCESFPKLGPYRKRSSEQKLWRIASNPEISGPERWDAIRKLLQVRPTLPKEGAAPRGGT
jgi:hypothetical protein